MGRDIAAPVDCAGGLQGRRRVGGVCLFRLGGPDYRDDDAAEGRGGRFQGDEGGERQSRGGFHGLGVAEGFAGAFPGDARRGEGGAGVSGVRVRGQDDGPDCGVDEVVQVLEQGSRGVRAGGRGVADCGAADGRGVYGGREQDARGDDLRERDIPASVYRSGTDGVRQAGAEGRDNRLHSPAQRRTQADRQFGGADSGHVAGKRGEAAGVRHERSGVDIRVVRMQQEELQEGRRRFVQATQGVYRRKGAYSE